jgi:16S rRNA (cytidine1402-2'-O)-methyltransferase
MSTLYLVATPIGNLEDITLRALRILGEVPLIAAEDTRTTRKLLTHHGVPAPHLVSYTERNRDQRTPELLAALDAGDVAVVSEAGTPGISDPSYHLVEAAIAAGHQVVSVPGATALVTALVVSGLPARRFHYLGFLPRKASERRKLLADAALLPETLVFFEAPHRIAATLADMLIAFGDRRIAVCRELTKVHEEIYRGTLSQAKTHFVQPRGEFTLVVEGAGKREEASISPDDLDELLRDLKRRGVRARDAVRRAIELSGRPHREVYRRWLDLQLP